MGILIGWYLAKVLIKNHNLKDRLTIITYVIIGIIIGGRFGYILFYDPNIILIICLTLSKYGKEGCLFTEVL